MKFYTGFYRLTGRPIIVGEFHFGVPGRGLAPGLVHLRGRPERGAADAPAQKYSCYLHGCPCGYFAGATRECRCSPAIIQRCLARISGPLIHRHPIPRNLSPAFSISFPRPAPLASRPSAILLPESGVLTPQHRQSFVDVGAGGAQTHAPGHGASAPIPPPSGSARFPLPLY